MPHLQFNNLHLAALSCAVPSYIQKIDLSPNNQNHSYLKSFVRQIGITQRHISVTEQTATDTGLVAATAALNKAGWNAKDLDVVIFLTQTPDFNPGTSNAVIIQHRLGMRKDVMAFDMTLGCSSFPYGLSVCGALLQQANINKILMLTGDVHWVDYKNKDELEKTDRFLNSEATTALLIDKKANCNVSISLYSDGDGYKYLFKPSAGARNAWRPFKKGRMPDGKIVGEGEYMDGIEVTSFATTAVVDAINEFLIKNNKTIEDYDGVVLHQANKQIVKTIAKRLKVDMEKVPLSLDRYGNTDGATVTTTIADAYANSSQNRLELLTCAFGVGLSWGVASIEIEPKNIVPIIEVEDGRFMEAYVEPLE